MRSATRTAQRLSDQASANGVGDRVGLRLGHAPGSPLATAIGRPRARRPRL